ncbi:MAG: hypothetical protein FVQ83_09745 [Chloroflexi bacterium]|nr:hypothetical protein [Chloroflexota bacterium]
MNNLNVSKRTQIVACLVEGASIRSMSRTTSAAKNKITSLDSFFRLAKAGFNQKHKTLRNSLAAGMGWPKERAISILKAA